MAADRAQIALNDLHQAIEYAIPFGAGGKYPELRDRFAGLELTEEQNARLAELDTLSIDIAMTFNQEAPQTSPLRAGGGIWAPSAGGSSRKTFRENRINRQIFQNRSKSLYFTLIYSFHLWR